jgi:hypothetical protein
MLTHYGFDSYWLPNLKDEVILFLDERICLIRAGLTLEATILALRSLWDPIWAMYGEGLIDQLTAQILSDPGPDCSRAAPLELPAQEGDPR